MGREPVLILDEPTSGLDPLMQREFLALLAEARADGRTVFLSSHNLVEVERSCDRVAIIRDGRIVETSGVGELLGAHWRSINLVFTEPASAADFDLPNVEIAALTGREVHLMVRGDINPLLERIARHLVADIAITTPDVEDLFLRSYRDDAVEHGELPQGVPRRLRDDRLARRSRRLLHDLTSRPGCGPSWPPSPPCSSGRAPWRPCSPSGAGTWPPDLPARRHRYRVLPGAGHPVRGGPFVAWRRLPR
jgi:hypothetical protein